MKKYLLVIYHYMEEETFLFDSIDDLLSLFSYDCLEDLFEGYRCCDIYIVSDVITKDNYKIKEVND